MEVVIMYLDPGLGGMMLQIIVAIVAFGGAIAFSMRRKIRAFFSKRKEGNAAPSTSSFAAEKSDASDEADVVDMLSDDDGDDG